MTNCKLQKSKQDRKIVFLKNRRLLTGFSIVEMLVVIAIIGFIGSIIFTQMSQSRARARDAEREQEIKSLQNTLALYVVNARTYPLWSSATTAFRPLTCSSADEIFTQLISGGAVNGPICDPLNTASYQYEYRTTNIFGSSYELRYSLETDSVADKSPGQQPPVSP